MFKETREKESAKILKFSTGSTQTKNDFKVQFKRQKNLPHFFFYFLHSLNNFLALNFYCCSSSSSSSTRNSKIKL